MDEAETYQALASKSRLAILRLVYKKSRSVEEISSETGLQPVSVRHHLQSLLDAGFIESYEELAGTVGRPKLYYKIAKEPQLVGFPKRSYLALSGYMINTMQFLFGLDMTRKLLGKVGVVMGENTVKKLESENEIMHWSTKDFKRVYINKYLEESGAEPEIIEAKGEKIVYRMYNCVFFELALRMNELICDTLHKSFHEGVSNAMGGSARISRLACMGKGDPYCENVFEQLAETAKH